MHKRKFELGKKYWMNWKNWLFWGGVFLISISYGYLNWKTNPIVLRNDLIENYRKIAAEQNSEIQIKENRIVELYNRVDENLLDGVYYVDSVLMNDKSLNKMEESELLIIIGEILYDNDSINQALQRFELAESISFSSPRSKAKKAGCYIKKGNYKVAMELLNQASEINYDFKWYKGNLYEVMNFRVNAIKEYNDLYDKNPIIYKYCADRIKELENPKSKLFTELVYKDKREKMYIFMK